jgi:hypothetical protein
MRVRTLRSLAWCATTAFVILLGRTVAYAVSPDPMATLLQQRAGGPALPLLTLISFVAGASAAVTIVFLAWLGVRERALLEERRPPRLYIGRALARAVVVWSAAAVAGGLLEAYVHWRAGLGWHGLHCVVGPVHRNLIPIDGALALVASAVFAAAEHVLFWMGRTLARLRAVPARARPVTTPDPSPTRLVRGTVRIAAGGARAPPAFS